MLALDAQTIGAVSAIASAIAALVSLFSLWRAPHSAAQLAENLREKAEASAEKRRLKISIFTTLMSERATFFSRDAVRAFNLIDVAFNNALPVRNAWAQFFESLDDKNQVPEHAKTERLRALLSQMSIDIGLSDELRSDDLKRIYYPIALAEEQQLYAMQRAQSLKVLQGTPPSANAAAPQQVSSIFPPSPKRND